MVHQTISHQKVHMAGHVTTILSWVSAHGCSQLKHQKLRVGGYTEEVLEWFNYPHASAHPRYAPLLSPYIFSVFKSSGIPLLSTLYIRSGLAVKMDRHVALLPSVRRLQYAKFVLK